MYKFSTIVILALAVCAAAEPIRQRNWGRRQSSARQQLAPTAAPRGYAAAGVTPAIPFDLPTETEQPDFGFNDNITPQPDEVYGLPELGSGQQRPIEPETANLQPDEVYGPPENAVQPEEVYGPPATVHDNPDIIEILPEIEDIDDEYDEVLVDEDGTVVSVSSTFEKPARLVFQRFPQGRQAPKAVPARLTKARIGKPAKLVYTARFQNNQRI